MPEPQEQQQRVNLVDPEDGSVVNAYAADLEVLLGEGYRVADAPEVERDFERQQYGEGFGNELQTFGESTLSGATLGLSDVAARSFAPEYADELVKRREFNPTADLLGQGTGLIGSTLLTGGESLLAKGAAVATAPARGLMAAGTAATAATAKLLGKEASKSLLGRALTTGASYAAGGALEGALFGAAKAATDDFLADEEITTERIVAGGARGALGGALAGGALGAGGSLAADTFKRAMLPALKRAVNAAGIDDFVSKRAYKAALGGRNVAAVRKADAYLGGPADVGETLLREGIVTPTSTSDSILAAASAKVEDIGAKIDDVYTRLDEIGKPASASKLWQRIDDDVIAPLRKSPVMRDVAESIEGKLSYLKEALARAPDIGDDITYRQMWELSKDLGKRAGFDRVPGVYNPASEAMKDAQRTIRKYLQESGDDIAKSAGGDDLIGELKSLNKTWSHVKHAQEISEAAIKRGDSNALLSPSDKGIGIAVALGDVITGGGISASTLAYGLVSGAVSKFFRERGAAMFSGTMYSMRQAPQLLKTARAGEQAVESATHGFIKALQAGRSSLERAIPATAASTAAHLARSDNYEETIRNIAQVTDPQSTRRKAIALQTEAVRAEYPALADSMDAHTQRVGDFIAERAGDFSVKAASGDPFGLKRKARHSPSKAAKLAKYIDAAQNPHHALDRISNGDIRREDIETLKALYPRIYQRVTEGVLSRLGEVDKLPSYDARLKLSHLLDAPADRSADPEYVQWLQSIVGSNAQEAASAQDGGTLAPSKRREPRLSTMYSTRSQDVLGSGAVK